MKKGFTPLESPVYSTGAMDKNLVQYKKDGVKASSFLTGFTLIELLVSMIIFFLCVIGILSLFVVGTGAHKRAVDNANVNLIAKIVLFELKHELTMSMQKQPKDINDKTITEYPNFKYNVKFTPLPGDPSNSAFITKVTVKWFYESREEAWGFDTVLIRKLGHKDINVSAR